MADAVASVPSVAQMPDEQKPDNMAVDQVGSTATDQQDLPTEDKQTASEPQVNGDATANTKREGAGEDTEMTGTGDAAEQSATEVANGAAPVDKKAKRKSSGVPEHKTKKTLKHKKSVKEFHTDAKPGELYLVRMKGHPSWPSIIADDDMLPESIADKRPVTAPNPDGTWKREEYGPNGKRHNDRTFAVMFLGTNEFAWIPNGDLTSLSVDECKDVSEKSKSKGLISAYSVAAEGHDLEYFKGLLNEHAEAVAEEDAARAEREADKARKADKKARRKSGATKADDDDEMDVDEDGAETKPKGKKRKKEAGEGDDNEKPAKTPKTTKLKLSNPKTPATGEKSAKKKETGAKNSTKKKAAAAAETADSEDMDTPVPEKELTAEEKHAKREQEVRFCRHKLQRGLLTRDNVPSDEEVKTMSTYLKKLEDYPELEPSIIRATKIHKVLKAMLKLQTIPRDEEFSFKKRSHELLAKWNKVLNENPALDDEPTKKQDDDKPMNSDAPSAENEKDATEKKEESSDTERKAEEKKATTKLDTPAKDDATKEAIGTTIEGEREADESEKSEKPAESAPASKTDEPDVVKAPAEEYKPSAENAETTTSS